MGQTASSRQVDYTFGLVLDNSKSDESIVPPPSYIFNKAYQDDIYNTYIGERLLLYPQQYGLDNNRESDKPSYDTSNTPEKRLSTPSTSSASSISFHNHLQLQLMPFYMRASTLNQQNIDRIDSGYADQYAFEPKKASHYHLHSRLAQDIMYVDQLYYTNTREKRQKQKDYRLKTALLYTNDDYTMVNDGDDDFTIGTKLTFAAAALASQDSTMRDICLSRRSLISLSPDIGLLTCVRKLNLCNNQLSELPDSIGQLKQLEILILSKNHLRHLPATMKYLTKLTELDLSYNHLQSITSLGHFSALCTLILSHNRLDALPSDLAGMKRLITMDLTKNPLPVLPAEVSQLSNLRRLRLDQCHNLLNYEEYQPLDMEMAHDPPTLVELCARTTLVSLSASSKKSKLPSRTKDKLSGLTTELLSYLSSFNTCSSCHKPYFESRVIRRRLIEKNNLWIPLEYHLCSAHWSDENDRLLNMFHQETSPFHQDMTSTLAIIYSLIIQRHQQQLSSPGPLCKDRDKGKSKSSGKSAFMRHPQRLQRVMNKNPSSFLIHKLHRG